MKSDTRKPKAKFSLADIDPRTAELVDHSDHRTLALWARDGAQRVLPYFEEQYPADLRPRHAITTLETWIDTGVFQMAAIRGAALASHAAAREVGADNPARAAARAAGQAVATAHVPTHSIGAANYAVQASWRATDAAHAAALVTQERDWQYRHLLQLTKAQDRAPTKAEF